MFACEGGDDGFVDEQQGDCDVLDLARAGGGDAWVFSVGGGR